MCLSCSSQIYVTAVSIQHSETTTAQNGHFHDVLPLQHEHHNTGASAREASVLPRLSSHSRYFSGLPCRSPALAPSAAQDGHVSMACAKILHRAGGCALTDQ